MKRMIVKEEVHGKKTTLNAKSIYRTDPGGWVAEVDSSEFNRACDELCHGIDNCTCENLHVEADMDDDGKVYSLVTG